MKEIGKIISLMGKERKSLKIETYIKELLWKVKRKEKVFIDGKTGHLSNIKEILKTTWLPSKVNYKKETEQA